MNQDNMMKWILLAVGAYLLLSWVKNRGAIPDMHTGTGPGTGTGTGPGTGTGTGTGPGTGTGTGTTTATPPPDSVLMQAAVDASKASLAGDYRLNWWQWNYYRMQGAQTILGIADPDPAVYQPKLDSKLSVAPDQRLTAAEYHQLLTQFGLSGLMWRSPQYWR
jgi:hypothetical protein